MRILDGVIAVLSFFDFIRYGNTYSTGAPTSTCSSMFPNHGPAEQVSAPPYEITVSQTSYTAGTVVTVTLRGTSGAQFKGYIMQMRRTDTSLAVGGFSLNGHGEYLMCNNQNNGAVTHYENGDKTNVSFLWTAPAESLGNVQVVATVVQNKQVFWMGVRSDTLTAVDYNSTVTSDAEQNSTQSSPGNDAIQFGFDFLALFPVIIFFLA